MKILALNLGNTTLFGGVFQEKKLLRSFRVPARVAATAAGFARLVGSQLKGSVEAVALCSVVPRRTRGLIHAVGRHTGVEPVVLTAAASPELRVAYTRPHELGTDRLAALLGAQTLFPRQNIIVVDCGTATTVTALRRDGTILGGAIFPGISLAAEGLARRTAQLPQIVPVRPNRALGRSPRAGIVSGVFYGQVGAIREVVTRIRAEAFGRARSVVLGTGGHAPLFGQENLFTRQEPDLILIGLRDFALRNFHHD